MSSPGFIQRDARNRPWPLTVFFFFVLLIPWLAFLLSRLRTSGAPLLPSAALILVVAWAPTVVALVITAASEGSAGVRVLVRRYRVSRERVAWLAVAALVPLVFTALEVLFARGSGYAAPFAASPRQLVGNFLLTLVTGATGEELGWRGFALPRLQARWNALNSTLILGALWAIWHIPSFFIFRTVGISVPLLPVLATIPALAFFLTFVFNQSGGSVSAAIVAHFSLNFASALGGAAQNSFTLWTGAGLAWVLALGIVFFFGSDAFTRSRSA